MYLQNIIDSLVFYKIMKFPIPQNKEVFYWVETKPTTNNTDKFSWENKSVLMQEYIDFINKYGFIFRSLPFVKNIYLCNSICFNSIEKDSDIDLLIICKDNRLWLARFFSVLIFQLFGIRRHGSKITKRFCLSFYITESNLNLYNFLIKPYDLYFTYWIIHLVPLYSEDESTKNNIYKENFWVNNYIPNAKLQQNVNIGNNLFVGNNYFKKFIHFIFGGIIGNIFNFLIGLAWKPLMNYKKNKLKNKAWGMIVSDTVLKFHGSDIRKLVNFKYKFYNKNK